MSEPEAQPDDEIATQIAELQPRLVGFAYTLTRDPEAASDLAQETIVHALAARWRFQPGTNLKAWLFRIMRNLQLNALRTEASRPTLVSIEELVTEPPELVDRNSDVEAQVILRHDIEQVSQAFRSLPTAFALPLHLTAIEGLRYAEAAEILGVPVGTVMSRIYRARQLLRARLTGEG